jgi:hypothetical protein
LAAAGIAALSGANPNSLVAALVFIAGVPLASLYVLYIWFSETQRVRRASYHIYGLEIKINKLYGGEKLLTWEQNIRGSGNDKPRFFSGHYLANLIFFCFIAFMSLIGGLKLLLCNIGVALGILGAVELFAMSGFLILIPFILGIREWYWLENNFNRKPDEKEIERNKIWRTEIPISFCVCVSIFIILFIVSVAALICTLGPTLSGSF